MNEQVHMITCGLPRDHKCNNDGPFLYGLKNDEVTEVKERAMKEGNVIECEGIKN